MTKPKAKSDRKIVVTGPSVSIDGKEILGFRSEFAASYNQKKLDLSNLRSISLEKHSAFLEEVTDALSEAASSLPKNLEEEQRIEGTD